MHNAIEFDPAIGAAVRSGADYARELGHTSLGTEHLLLGFLRTNRDLFLHSTNSEISELILAKLRHAPPIDPGHELPVTPAVVRALSLPVPNVQVTARPVVTMEDVVLAMIDDTSSLAGTVLRSLGIISREDFIAYPDRK
ncbi:MAG: Clp protease N-terminal domain-containing protein [Longimicrobiales bacterium]